MNYQKNKRFAFYTLTLVALCFFFTATSQQLTKGGSAKAQTSACNISGPLTVCAGGNNYTYTATTDAIAPVYLWQFINNTSGAVFVGNSTGASVSVNPGNSVGQFKIKAVITNVAGGTTECISENVDVNSAPVAYAIANQAYCNGSTAPLTVLSSSAPGTTFTWTNSNTAIGLPANGNGNVPSFSAINPGNNPITATISVIPIAAGCSRPPSGYAITINPTPKITLGTSPSFCRPATSVTLSYSGVTVGTDQYSIDFDNAANSAGLIDVVNSSLGASPIMISVPASVACNLYNATLTVRNSSTGCVSSVYPFTIYIKSAPVVYLEPKDYVFCRNNFAAIFDVLASGCPQPSIQWYVKGNGPNWTAIPGANSASYQFVPSNTNDGNRYRAVFTNECGKDTSRDALLTISGGVNFPNQDNNAYTCGNSATFEIKATGGSGLSGTLTAWWQYSVDGNPPWINIPNTTTTSSTGTIISTFTASPSQFGYHLRLAVENNGCITFSHGGKIITPVVTPPDNIVTCHNQPVSVAFANANTSSYTWTNNNTSSGLAASGTGDISFIATNTTSTPITSTITITPYGTIQGVTCAGESKSFTITVNPLPPCSITGNNNVCPSTINTYSAPGGMSQYSWSISGGAVISGSTTNPSVAVIAGTSCALPYTLTVNLKDTNGCTSSCSQTFNVAEQQLTLSNAQPRTVPACRTQADVNAAYTQWLSSVTASGGCSLTLTNDAPASAPPACGGVVTVTWRAASSCDTLTTTATFRVTAAPPLNIS